MRGPTSEGLLVTLGEVERDNDLSRIPRIDPAEIRLLWHVDFWDGPKSGVLSYRGEQFWFQLLLENDDDITSWYRRFVVVRLSEEQLADERRWHELFRQHVGVHTDYDERGQSAVSPVQPREWWDRFYTPYQQRLRPDLSSNEVVGWYER